ncbi:Transcriptional factor MdcH [Pseudomonas savastanoi pv. glycinea]|nr:Transcriptional factor MdcH [Pseudomonas savastanoi pv. glycinea]
MEQVADTHESLLRDDAADVWGAVAESTRCSAGITVTQSLARLTAAGYPISRRSAECDMRDPSLVSPLPCNDGGSPFG